MRIDAHAHACGYYLTPESIAEKIKKNGIDKIVLFPGELASSKTYEFSLPGKSERLMMLNKIIRIVTGITASAKSLDDGNRYVNLIREKIPGRIIQFYWATKRYFDSIESDFQKMKFRGIKLHQGWEYFRIKSDFFEKIMTWAEKRNMPVLIHLYSYRDVRDLMRFVKGRRIRIIIAHLFGAEFFRSEWSKIRENVYFDISNCYWISRERLEKALLFFGSSKLIFGSDTPYGKDSLENTIRMVESLKISREEKDLILDNNMKKLLRF